MAQMNLFTNSNGLTDIENKLVVDKAEGEEKSGEGEIRSLGFADSTTIYRMDEEQGPTVQHRKLYSVASDQL